MIGLRMSERLVLGMSNIERDATMFQTRRWISVRGRMTGHAGVHMVRCCSLFSPFSPEACALSDCYCQARPQLIVLIPILH